MMHKPMVSALVIFLVLVGWMLSGPQENVVAAPSSSSSSSSSSTATVTEAVKKEKEKEKENKARMRVKTQLSTAIKMQRFLHVKGQVEPLRVVILRAETQGRVVKLPVPKGARVAAGTVLVQLSLNDRVARLHEVQAMVKQREQDLAAARKLYKSKLKAVSQLKAEEAKMAAAKARLQQIRWEIANTKIKTPFAGMLNDRPVELGAFMQIGDPVATLLDDSALLLTAQAPQMTVVQLKLGQPVDATLVNGVTLHGTLRFVSAIADQETRSYRIEAHVANPQNHPYTGLSATLSMPVGQRMAHKIPVSALGLDDQGRLIVKGVNENSIVEVHPVTLVQRQPDTMWVEGLPPTFHLITLGHAYLLAGEKVIAMVAKRGL